MTECNHPTKRLHEIIGEIFEADSPFLGERPTQTLGQALANIIGVDANDEVETRRAYIDFILLAKEASVEVLNNEKARKDLHIDPIQRIEAVITKFSSKATCSEFVSRIGSTDLIHLDHIINLTESLASEPLIDKAELDDLLSKVIKLKEEVYRADLYPVFKEFLVEQLINIERSILAYKINGVKGLKRALEMALGSYAYIKMRVHEDLDENQNLLIRKFWDIATKIDIAISLGTAAVPLLPNGISKFLQG